MNKLLLVAAGAAGYVLGARAGRARYEQIRQHSAEVWNSAPVQRGVDDVTSAAKQGAGVAGSKIADAAKQAGSAVVDRVGGDDETSTSTSSVDDLLDRAPVATPDPAAPAPGEDSGPLSTSTPTAPASPPTAGDLDPNKHL